jgi:hypothetical protein
MPQFARDIIDFHRIANLLRATAWIDDPPVASSPRQAEEQALSRLRSRPSCHAGSWLRQSSPHIEARCGQQLLSRRRPLCRERSPQTIRSPFLSRSAQTNCRLSFRGIMCRSNRHDDGETGSRNHAGTKGGYLRDLQIMIMTVSRSEGAQ